MKSKYSCPTPWTAKPNREDDPEGLWKVEHSGSGPQPMCLDLTREDAELIASAPAGANALIELAQLLESVRKDVQQTGASMPRTLALVERWTR